MQYILNIVFNVCVYTHYMHLSIYLSSIFHKLNSKSVSLLYRYAVIMVHNSCLEPFSYLDGQSFSLKLCDYSLGRGIFPPLLFLSFCGWNKNKIDTRQIQFSSALNIHWQD